MILQWVQTVEIVGKKFGFPKTQRTDFTEPTSHVTQSPFPMDL